MNSKKFHFTSNRTIGFILYSDELIDTETCAIKLELVSKGIDDGLKV